MSGATDLLETTLDEVVTRKPDVLRGAKAFERDLVLIRLLQLLPGDDFLDEPLLTVNDNERSVLHLLGLFLADDTGSLAHLLEILTGLVTPEHVLERGLVEVVIDVVESVLSDVTNDQVGVLPDLTALVRLHVTDEELDEGRLSGTVRTENGNTGRKGNLEGNIMELLDGRARVLEADFAPGKEGKYEVR